MPRPKTALQFLIFVLLYGTAALPAIASDLLCPLDEGLEHSEKLILEAGQVDQTAENEYLLQHSAHVSYRGIHVFAEELNLNTEEKIVNTKKNFRLISPQRRFEGKNAEINLESQSARFARVSFTTCPQDHEFWSLKASRIRLENAQNKGTAKDVSLQILDVPVMYIPYISFPLGRRKSGFISPDFGNGSNTGIEIATPFYWNIAPNWDSTITPRILSKRGLMLSDELRYLVRHSKGKTWVEVLPQDRQKKESRSFLAWEHRRDIGSSSVWQWKLQRVSDTDYFRDLGSNLSGTSSSALERYAEASSYGRHWAAQLDFFDYQVLNDAPHPYRRLPQLTFEASRQYGLLEPRFQAQYQWLQHDQLSNLHTLELAPALGILLQGEAAYLLTRSSIISRRYLNASESNQWRGAEYPTLSIDGGIYFDRLADRQFDTLKPRVYYLWRPEVKQQLPQIDRVALETSVGHVFSENQTAGFGELASEHRISGGLEYAVQFKGRPRLTLALAQTLYLQDQASAATDINLKKQGDMISTMELSWSLTRRLNIQIQQSADWQKGTTENSLFRVKYAGNNEYIGLNYIDRGPENDAVVSGTAFLGLSSRWSILSRASYIPGQQDFQELLLGGEFQSCCWRLQINAQAYKARLDDQLDYRLGILFELKGLTNIGKDWFNEIRNDLY